MWKTIQGLLASKKAFMAFISALIWLLGKAKFDIETEALAGTVAPFWVYIFGQGVADMGKEKALVTKAEKEAPATPVASPADSEDLIE